MNTDIGLCIKYNEEIKMSSSHNPARTTLFSEHASQVPSPHPTLGEDKGCGPCPTEPSPPQRAQGPAGTVWGKVALSQGAQGGAGRILETRAREGFSGRCRPRGG